LNTPFAYDEGWEFLADEVLAHLYLTHTQQITRDLLWANYLEDPFR